MPTKPKAKPEPAPKAKPAPKTKAPKTKPARKSIAIAAPPDQPETLHVR